MGKHAPKTEEINMAELEPFAGEINQAVQHFDRFIVCLDRPPDHFLKSLLSLLSRASKAYQSRSEGARHGVACDSFVTVIISHADPKPLCGIYFNLYSPHMTKNSLQNKEDSGK